MNGAEYLVQALVKLGVDTCVTNPGTSEMHFVNALDSVEGIRPVLGLHEGVVTGMADGYGRMSGKPAITLLHLGPGLSNGLANLHNARRAGSPVVNIVGDHATTHLQYDSPLQSDVEGIARPVSTWVKTVKDSASIARDAAEAVAAAYGPPGGISTLVLPADLSWNPVDMGNLTALERKKSGTVAPDTITRIASILSRKEPTMLLLRGEALYEKGLAAAGRVSEVSGATICSDTFVGRMQRGVGRAKVRRLPYFAEGILKSIEGIKHLILVGTKPPVSFFAYPDKPSWLTPEGCEIHVLTEPEEDSVQALRDLADELGAPAAVDLYPSYRPELEKGMLTPSSIAAAAGAFLPENAIISDESGTSGLSLLKMTSGCPPHDWMFLTGGSIGQGLPVATGASLACPDRKVVCFCGDGGAMQTIQALWTQARENLDITTVIFSNRKYAILQVEFNRVGVVNPGPRAMGITSLDHPALDFVQLARGMGVQADRATTAEEFNTVFESAIRHKGPHLIEAVI